MGSHAITYAVVALAIAVTCLFAGFSWGRSNVRAQIEDAVEKEHVALDAREFAMRTQLEDAIAELAKLRPEAEELGRVQKRLEREQTKYRQMKAEFNAATGAPKALDEDPEAEVEAAPPAVSADEAIQKLMQSLEVFNAPNDGGAASASEPEPTPVKQVAPTPPVAPPVVAAATPPKAPEPPRTMPPPVPSVPHRVPAQSRPQQSPPPAPRMPEPVAPLSPAPPPPTAPVSVPAKSANAEPAKPGQQVDEWQEFARQLEALTGKKK
ncbi:MAG: hypothetical protein JST28_15780 [Acidobacteria bacterium]|nr:hypothetical protein [Acidobacteriota bacterium]